jgi:hypothetical protein
MRSCFLSQQPCQNNEQLKVTHVLHCSRNQGTRRVHICSFVCLWYEKKKGFHAQRNNRENLHRRLRLGTKTKTCICEEHLRTCRGGVGLSESSHGRPSKWNCRLGHSRRPNLQGASKYIFVAEFQRCHQGAHLFSYGSASAGAFRPHEKVFCRLKKKRFANKVFQGSWRLTLAALQVHAGRSRRCCHSCCRHDRSLCSACEDFKACKSFATRHWAEPFLRKKEKTGPGSQFFLEVEGWRTSSPHQDEKFEKWASFHHLPKPQKLRCC